MILDRLRNETIEAHQALEKLIIPQLKHTNAEKYISLLRTFYGYYQPVEKLLDNVLTGHDIPMYNNRRKATVILQDLADMRDTESQPDICTALPLLDNKAKAMGAMYVLEGSTLGGKIISKMLAQQLQPANGKGISFFGGYGSNNDMMWASFTNALNAYPATSNEQEEMVCSARDTFEKFREWIAARQ